MQVGDLVRCLTATDFRGTPCLGLVTRVELRPEPLGRPIDRFYPDDVFYVCLVHHAPDSGFPFRRTQLELVK
jgi:hypothetical protein